MGVSRRDSDILELARPVEWPLQPKENRHYRLKREDIVFGRPRKMDFGVYRLMLEIDHVHRGTICACERKYFQPMPQKGPKSCLRVETVGDYGFDGLNPWERWHFKLLYRELLDVPAFDAREMLVARRSAVQEALQNYIEKLVDVKK